MIFTGMIIASLPITSQTKTTIEITTNDGKVLKFDKKTLTQINAPNPRYANKIEL